MGLYLRKSVSVGPFRFNLSGSGVGMSVGVRGFRVGSGPRGNYVHLGMGGVHYRRSLPGPDPASRPTPSVTAGTPPATHAPLEEIESSMAATIVDSSSEQLLTEIREKQRMMSLTPVAVVASLVLLLFVLNTSRSVPTVLFSAVLAVSVILAARYRDRIRKTVVILYDFDPPVEEAFLRFTEWAQAVASSRRAWHIAASGQVYDRKYHAGASELVRRNPTTLRTSSPPFIETNVPVISLGAGRQTLYFLPDRLLVYEPAGVGAVTYRTLEISVTSQRFIEDSGAPADATVVGHTWRYVNKSGGPDRRFNHNPQLPICLYDEMNLHTSSGLRETFHVSRSGTCTGFASAVRYLASVGS
jgi:hypothetical protein